jgi:hypothetical protein
MTTIAELHPGDIVNLDGRKWRVQQNRSTEQFIHLELVDDQTGDERQIHMPAKNITMS